MRRYPAVSGMFYPSDEESLRKEIERCFNHELGPRDSEPAPPEEIIGGVSPHAGYMYSGPVAAHIYNRVRDKNPERVVIIGPNHTGWGAAISVYPEGYWVTPLGEIKVSEELSEELSKRASIVTLEEEAHINEHSIEVQLPFLQFLFGNSFEILPICLMFQDLNTSIELGKAISEIIDAESDMVIASSDFSHYEPYEVAVKKDREAINEIMKLDERKFYEVIEGKAISVCGPGAISALMVCSKKLGFDAPNLLKYANSGDVTGNLGEVVGYASISFERKQR